MSQISWPSFDPQILDWSDQWSRKPLIPRMSSIEYNMHIAVWLHSIKQKLKYEILTRPAIFQPRPSDKFLRCNPQSARLN